jgi:hypothetical protein
MPVANRNTQRKIPPVSRCNRSLRIAGAPVASMTATCLSTRDLESCGGCFKSDWAKIAKDPTKARQSNSRQYDVARRRNCVLLTQILSLKEEWENCRRIISRHQAVMHCTAESWPLIAQILHLRAHCENGLPRT